MDELNGLERRRASLIRIMIITELERQMYEELKVKHLSLAAEARIIRRIEQQKKRRMRDSKLTDEKRDRERAAYHSLHQHRVDIVRRETRIAHLARGFLKGRPYRQMEQKCHDGNDPPWSRVEKLVQKYSVDDQRNLSQRFAEWMSKEEKLGAV